MTSPRVTIQVDIEVPPALVQETVTTQKRVTLLGHEVCAVRPGEYMRKVKSRCAQILGLESCRLFLFQKSLEELELFPQSEVAVLSEQTSKCILFSGREIDIPARMPVSLVYEHLSAQLQCEASQLQLVYDCALGCEVHSKATAPPLVPLDWLDPESISKQLECDASCCRMCPLIGGTVKAALRRLPSVRQPFFDDLRLDFGM